VMKTLGVCDALTGKIVHGADIAQTFQFVYSGNAEFGFVALSQVIARPSGSRWIVPANLPWVQHGQARRRKFREGSRAGAFSSPRQF
jgi:ABC-type molybdate transport system substrate-binding protein